VTHLRTLLVRAPAKVNLFLRVLGRREDGFHELLTVFQAIGLFDRIEVSLTDGGIALEVVGPDLGPDPENLAFRAARALLEEVNTPLGARIRLEKHIPAGAGLGGGSSDAAGVLVAVNRLLGGPLPSDRLASIGADLGSDVPFFLGEEPLALGRGRGESLVALPSLPEATLVLVIPPAPVGTDGAYAALAEHRRERGWKPPENLPGPGAWRAWSDVSDLAANDFEDVVPRMYPEVAAGLRALADTGAEVTMLSGSGGACFGLFVDERAAEAARGVLEARLAWPVRTAKTLSSFPGLEAMNGHTGT
jgi:4-diphosphocytidyl-2-C-methyl-D-erythritol kinase